MLFLGDFSVIKPDPGLLLWTIIIFGIFWFIMSKVAFKPIAEGLKKREVDIQSALDEAKKARAEMATLKSENEELLRQAREERSAILKEAKEAKEEIIAEAKERAHGEYKRKVESASQDIENLKQAALIDMKNQAGQMAIEIAEKVMRKELANNGEQVNFAKTLASQIHLN